MTKMLSALGGIVEWKISAGSLINFLVIVAGGYGAWVLRGADLANVKEDVKETTAVLSQRVTSVEDQVDMLRLFNAELRPKFSNIEMMLGEVRQDVKAMREKSSQ